MWKLEWPWKKETLPATRAPRVHAEVPLHYRVAGGFAWQMGKTQNISESGVLFRAQRIMQVGTAIEMNFSPPKELWNGSSRISCRAKVVRTVASTNRAELPSAAARFTNVDAAQRSEDW